MVARNTPFERRETGGCQLGHDRRKRHMRYLLSAKPEKKQENLEALTMIINDLIRKRNNLNTQILYLNSLKDHLKSGAILEQDTLVITGKDDD